jgi:DNA-binding LacI/PurR family transcriptional regulator
MAQSRHPAPPERRITARAVAERAGVSMSAVSRTFTEGASVSEKTRAKVLAAAAALDYQPNVLARSLMTRRTDLIGLVSNNFANPAFMEVFDLFTQRLQQRGRRPLLANLSAGEETARALDMLLQYNVDGAIVASSTLPPALVQACLDARLPVVLAFGKFRGKQPVNVVGVDDVQGGRLAGELLLERGYRRVAFLGGPRTASSTSGRLKGLRIALRKAGRRPVAETSGAAYSHEAGIAGMRELLRQGGIDSVFCGDDILAMGALDACREAGIAVPESIGVVGFNDIAMAAWPAYDLTTIRQPIGDITVAAVEMLLALIDRPDRPPQAHSFPCEAVVRGTLRPPKKAGR